ncbi:unnamed protein product [Diatraea saccharalis]|uniref:RNA exonuclease 4 n=1 Tax=Diatraea saccharalis TaxID=40085 RepID=A0A9N9WDL1_9NEOP|nr:unnamed protein product [Diatraea saccharalis]
MDPSWTQTVIYLLLVLLEYILNTIFGVCYNILFTIKKLLYLSFNEIMTETSQKRKRNMNENHTVAARGIINANWQKLLSSNLLSDQKTENPSDNDKNNHYTGTFRRARKKKAQQATVENNLKTLNLNKSHNNNIQPAVSDNTEVKKVDSAVKDNNKNRVTKFIAMDCEMVGIGHDGNDHMLARVSLVNKFGDCLYDKFVKAREEVVDYRTEVSGIRREDMLNGTDFNIVQQEVADIIKGRVLVGHSLKNDLAVLFLSHPKRNIRDTSKYKPFRKITKGSTPSLKRLAKEILGIDIQHGEHSSIEDARAAMQLYCTVAKKWEATMSDKRGYNKKILDE